MTLIQMVKNSFLFIKIPKVIIAFIATQPLVVYIIFIHSFNFSNIISLLSNLVLDLL